MERNVVLACKIHGSQLEYGNKEYNNIDDTIQINLNNFRCNKNNILSSYYLANLETKEILTNKFRIDMVDLVLGSKMCYTINDKLSKWCRLFMTRNRSECHELTVYLLGNKKGAEFMNEIDMLCSDDEYIGIYTKLSKKELEYNTYIVEAKEEEMRKRNIDIAKNMLKENIDTNTISRITDLSQKQIDSLQ